jgi:enoyl-CoA hydratase
MNDVILRVQGTAGRITLNRPQALNALTLDMVRVIDAELARWAQDEAVRLVLVDGAGARGLCAGGDIRALYDAARRGDLSVAAEFFGAEYAMNLHIARFAKPYVAIMDGVVMGGGVGISAHGSVRVVTERTLLAMPETGIGLFTDVGATWLLSRQPALGTHLALTGARLGAADVIEAGLADYFVPSGSLPALAEALCGCADRDAVAACVRSFAEPPPQGELAAGRAWIEAAYAADSVEEILARLADRTEDGARAAAAAIATKSPTSLKVTLRALRDAGRMRSLEEALAQELVLAVNCAGSHDFLEGVRAVLVDKDRTPRWSPALLGEVSHEMVEGFFKSKGLK